MKAHSRLFIVLMVVLFFEVGLVFTGCIQESSRQSSPTNLKPNYSTPRFIIDAHLHYRPTDEWENSFLEIYTKRNAMACILVSMTDLDRGIARAKAHPDRAIPFARIHLDSLTVLEDIRSVHSMGFKGLGEVASGNRWQYDHPEYDPVWELAEELGMPVLLHTGVRQTGSFALLRPVHLAKKEDDPAIWLQYLWWTSAIDKPHTPPDARPAFESIVFGTDEVPDHLEENIRRFNRMLDACDVPQETREEMYGLTMARILGISVD